ncbi:MAG: hypothetical protein GWO27_04150, partial [Thermoplasmata archaeon]|nr:hypothetical protein [Thermoplasmata archaeon]
MSLALPLAAGKRGNDITSIFFDVKTGRKKEIKAGEALRATVAFPDQYERKRGKLRPRGRKVRATRNGEIVHVDAKEVDYVIPSPRALFGVSANMIPFLQNNQGNRAMTASRQAEQAVPLDKREAPLVQVKTDREESFEELMGRLSSARAPADGTVVQVRKDSVVVRDRKGKKHDVQIYRDFALKGNSLYDSEVKVKA